MIPRERHVGKMLTQEGLFREIKVINSQKEAGKLALLQQIGSGSSNIHENRMIKKEGFRQIFIHMVGEDTWQSR